MVLTGLIRCGQADSRARNSATTKSNRSRRMAYSGPATDRMSSRSQRANSATSSANAIALASAGRADRSFWRPGTDPCGRDDVRRRLAFARAWSGRRWLRRPGSPGSGPAARRCTTHEKHHRGRGPRAEPPRARRGAPRRNRRRWPRERSLGRPVPAAGCPRYRRRDAASGLSKKQKVEAASTPTKTGSLAWKISSSRPMRMRERSYCWLIARAGGTALCTMLCTVPTESR